MIDLDQDPFLIEDWEQYAKDCINRGETWRFRKALSDYIFYLNRPLKAELDAYINKRRGEIDRQELEEVIKRKKSR